MSSMALSNLRITDSTLQLLTDLSSHNLPFTVFLETLQINCFSIGCQVHFCCLITPGTKHYVTSKFDKTQGSYNQKPYESLLCRYITHSHVKDILFIFKKETPKAHINFVMFSFQFHPKMGKPFNRIVARPMGKWWNSHWIKVKTTNPQLLAKSWTHSFSWTTH